MDPGNEPRVELNVDPKVEPNQQPQVQIMVDPAPNPKKESVCVMIMKIIFAIILPNLGGAFGAIYSKSQITEWYPMLEKPSWTPPNWIFAPMWVFLYTLMGIASYLVYRFGGGLKGPAKWGLIIYLVNLALNWSWTPIFFNGQNIFGTSGVSPLSAKIRSQRISELPSLRYGPVGARTTMTGPLRLSNNCRNQNRERRSSSADRDREKERPIRPPRKVRFTLPPSDGSPRLAGGNTENSVFLSRNSAEVAGIFNVNTEKRFSQRPNVKRFQLKEKQSDNAGEKFSLSRRFEKFRREHLQSKREVFGEGVEVPVCVSSGVRSRVHPTGRYIKGTLSPTSNQAPHEPPVSPGGQALLRAARDGEDQALREQLRRALAVGIGEADLNATDSSGRTILSYIASNGTIDLLELILQIPGLDPNKPDNEGNTPLHFAAQAGQVECLNCLASRCRGVEIDARNNLGFTALMKAALQGRNKCAKLLLFAGANPTLRDNGRGFRADQWARFCGRYVCADVIEKHARQRLLERSTSYGSWGLEHEMGARVVMGKVVPIPPVSQPQSNGLKSKLKKVFRTSSGPSSDTFSSARLVTQLTSAALCASSPVLPNSGSVPSVVKSLIRPLTVPRLQITLVNNNGDYPNYNLDNPESERDDREEKNAHSNKTVAFADDNKVVSSNGVITLIKNEMVKPARTKKKK